jgi:hypothetical protein
MVSVRAHLDDGKLVGEITKWEPWKKPLKWFLLMLSPNPDLKVGENERVGNQTWFVLLTE